MTTNSDDMSPLLVSTIVKKAINTFSSKPEIFRKNLDQLVNIFSNITSSHVNLHPMFMKETTWIPKTKAPMTYIHIFNDEIINVGIFILKPNMKLPLHNHPEMFGLLKVIAGTVTVRSYSLNTEKTQKYILQYSREPNPDDPLCIVAEKMKDVVADSQSQCCILDPNLGNIHEIESMDGPAAFIDILSPPYDVDIPDVGERKCSYFSVEKELESEVFELKEINTPDWFWSDSFPYTGPPLFNDV